MNRRHTVITLLALAAIAVLAVHSIGVFVPEPSSADERVFLDGLRRIVTGNTHPVAPRFLLQSYMATPFTGWLGPSRAGFALSLLASLLAILWLALAARRLFGNRAGWVCAGMSVGSLILCNFAVKVLAVSVASAFVALALYGLTCRSRWLWALGGTSLGLAFALHYHVGTLAIAIVCGVILSDLYNYWPSRAKAFLAVGRRAWVGLIALAVVAGHQVLLSVYYDVNSLSRLLSHENFDVPLTHSSFRWLFLFLRLDPWATTLAGVVFVLVWRRRHDLPLLSAAKVFLGPREIFASALCLPVVFTLFRGLASMTRQLVPGWLLLIVAASGCVAYAWSWHASRTRWAVLAFVVLTLVSTGLAARDWLASRNIAADRMIKTAVSRALPDRPYEVLRYRDFLARRRGVRTVKRFGRRPDLVMGTSKIMLFPYYEEEPYKTDRIERDLRRSVGDLLSTGDVVYTTVLYTDPPITLQERELISALLPWRADMAMEWPLLSSASR